MTDGEPQCPSRERTASFAEVASGYELGVELIRNGKYFEAHEALEDEWRSAAAEERDFLQGLVHVAVAWYHAGRGNRNGCERQLAKATRRLVTYVPSHRGLDVSDLLDQVRAAAVRVEKGDLALDPVEPH
jgi:uncharacterized protein